MNAVIAARPRLGDEEFFQNNSNNNNNNSNLEFVADFESHFDTIELSSTQNVNHTEEQSKF